MHIIVNDSALNINDYNKVVKKDLPPATSTLRQEKSPEQAPDVPESLQATQV